MEFLKLLLAKSKLLYLGLVFLSIVNGLLNIGLLTFINHAITQTAIPIFPEYDWVLFILLILAAFATNKVFQSDMIKLTTEVNFDFEMAILEKLRYATYQDFEKLGKEKVFTAMGDIRNLGNIPEVLMNAINSTIVVICGFIYLFWQSVLGATVVLATMSFLLVFYILRNVKIEKELEKLRDLQNHFFRYINDLLYGFKELKMSATRNENIHTKFLKKNRFEGRKIAQDTRISYLNNELTGSFSWYIIIGIIMFGLPRFFDLDFAKVSSFLITILYLMGPIAVLIVLVPTFTHVKIAVSRLNKFSKILSENLKEKKIDQINIMDDRPDFNEIENIEFKDLFFEYIDDNGNVTFTFGPFNLDIKRGELIFVTGGNGSGKSTFVNLITGLYKPKSGKIFINNREIDKTNISKYIKKLSAIFTNPYLFSENYDDFKLSFDNRRLMEFIKKMKLVDIVRIDEVNARFDNNLSKGQQKRLAMILALLEERKVLILDEWAAEQDPEYRAYFYNTLLPELQKQNKTVIAITHDDAYFHCADRVIKLNNGKIVTGEEILNYE